MTIARPAPGLGVLLALLSLAGFASASSADTLDDSKAPKPGASALPKPGSSAAPKPGASATPAAAEYFAEISVLHATNTKKGIDRRIGEMPELKKPPFSAYDSYALLQQVRLPLAKNQAKTLKLVNERVLEAKLLEILGKDQVRLSASINQPGGDDFLPLLEVKAKVGQAFIVAGQSYKSGILVLVIRIVK
jgi:hypothetical protein